MMDCNTPDFLFPMRADIYYPIISQNKYGQPTKSWFYDRSVVCNATHIGGAKEEEVKPETILQNESVLVARTRCDIRVSSNLANNAITNILVTNIRDLSNNNIYVETSGPRNGKSTLYEVATVQPFFGPFNSIEYYKIVLRRAENQEATD